MFNGIQIKGISIALPKEVLELTTFNDTYGEQYIKKVSSVTGIYRIRVAPDDKSASDYCVAAAFNLFEDLKIDKGCIDALVFVSQSPDYMVPHTSAIMQHRLGLSNHIATFDLNYGCPGYVYGLLHAYSLINSGAFNNVLLCCGDTMTNTINDKDKALRMVMGDGGSATLITKGGSSSAYFSCYTDGSRADKLIVPAGARRLPKLEGVTDVLEEDCDGNKRTKENLFMDGMEVMNFALTDVVDEIKALLERVQWTKEEVGLFALHQANALIVKYLAKKLKVKLDKAPIEVSDTGNLSSASIPLMLCKHFHNKDVSLDLTKVIMCGFGTGLSCVTCALSLEDTYFGQIIEI